MGKKTKNQRKQQMENKTKPVSITEEKINLRNVMIVGLVLVGLIGTVIGPMAG